MFIAPPIPILRQSVHHRGDEIIVELLSSTNTTNDDDHSQEDNYYKLYNQQEEDDLATSLRCYRGPLLLAVSLFFAAYSLRVWRRGGCACDELLFLPGTPHECAIIARVVDKGRGGEKVMKKKRDCEEEEEDVEMMNLNDEDKNIEQQSLLIEGQHHRNSHNNNNSSSGMRTTTITPRKSRSSPRSKKSPSSSSSSPSTIIIHGSQSNSSLMMEDSFSEGDAAAAGGGTSSSSAQIIERQSILSNNDTEQQHHHHQQLMNSNTTNNNNNNNIMNSPPSPTTTTQRTSSSASLSPLIAADDSPMGYLRERAWSGLNMLVVTENFGGGGGSSGGLSPPPPSLPELSVNHDSSIDDGGNVVEDGGDNGGLYIGNGSGESDATASSTNLPSRRTSSTTNNNTNDTTDNNKERYDVDYAPSGPSVLGAALDLTLPVLFNFHMFVVLMKDHYRKEAIEAGIVLTSSMEEDVQDTATTLDSTTTTTSSSIFTPPELPPKILPLIFLTGVLVRTQFPRRQRTRFYKTILHGTILAPFKPVRFRDAFVGDIVTSLVRPIVDVVFTSTYYGAAVYGFCSRRYDLNETGYIVSESVLLHGIVLPLVAIAPLWMRFLQTLRQAYDTGKRWPYLGNAFKYLTAGLVVLYGMTHAAGERGAWWIASFTAATLYQIVWDSCIDWEMLVVVRNDAREMKESLSTSSSGWWWWRCPTCISSMNPRFFPTTLLMYVVQPFRRRVGQPLRRVWELMPKRFDQIRLRPKRLFDDDKFYWRALFVNAALRFCWMMGFIPAYRVSIMDGSTQETFADKFNGWSFVILGALEIFRRSIWGIIKVELETIKLTSGGENDLTMASTADEYLREGKWNAWRRNNNSGLSASNDDNAEEVEQDEEDSQIVWLNPRGGGERRQHSPQTESFIFQHQSGNQTHRWLGIAVSSNFIRAAYKVELLLWPVVFLVLSYMVVLIE